MEGKAEDINRWVMATVSRLSYKLAAERKTRLEFEPDGPI